MRHDTRIQSLTVKGLHDNYDVYVEFNTGLNIIYGKNGRGKTTILHILANSLELDFERFKYLSFRQIVITTYGNSTLTLQKSDGSESIEISLVSADEKFFKTLENLSEDDVQIVREHLGTRPTYLPAFRAVLERSSERYSPSYRSDVSESELLSIRNKEVSALTKEVKSAESSATIRYGTPMEEADSTAKKTVQCRQWFGNFVPTIRYPSILDVSEGLTTEWRTAHLDISRKEQNMYAEVFVKVFRTIVGLDTPQNDMSSEVDLNEIAELLNDSDMIMTNENSNSIYQQLREAAEHSPETNHQVVEIEKAVLHLYKKMLSSRRDERNRAFQKSKEFEESVNKFLDKKKLKIGVVEDRHRSRYAVSVGTEGGRNYGLTSLSSGEKQLITMLYSASRSRFNDGLFLIDEPELSLHIDWQRQILQEIMANANDRQIIACTHSPEVGGDHLDETQDFEPSITNRVQESLFGIDDVEE